MASSLVHSPTRAQSEILLDGSRYRVWAAGRRCGKTTCMIYDATICAARAPNQVIWYVAPYRNQAKELFWEPFKEKAAPNILKTHEGDLWARMRNGSVVSVKGADNEASLVGRGLNRLYLDEAGDIAKLKLVWEKRLSPALADKKGDVFFGGSPQGRNYFYELWKKGGVEAGWRSFLTKSIDGGLITPEEIAERRANMDPKHFASEFEASFDNTIGGRCYYCYDQALNRGSTSYVPHLPIAWSMDFNIGFMCSVVAQSDGDKAWVLDELALPDTNLYEMCAEFIRRCERDYLPHIPKMAWQPRAILEVELFGDSTGNNRNHSGDTDWRIVREQLSKVPWMNVTYRVIRNPEQKDRVNSVNAMLCAADGRRRLIIDPKCHELDADFDQVQWAEDSSGNLRDDLNKKDPKRTHISDALGYWIWATHGIKSGGKVISGFVA